MDEYFDNIQEYIKNNADMKDFEIEELIKTLNNDNIQAVINQDFNNRVSVDECAEKVMQMDNNNDHTKPQAIQPDPNVLDGERGANTMERRIHNFTDFVNENKKITLEEALELVKLTEPQQRIIDKVNSGYRLVAVNEHKMSGGEFMWQNSNGDLEHAGKVYKAFQNLKYKLSKVGFNVNESKIYNKQKGLRY